MRLSWDHVCTRGHRGGWHGLGKAALGLQYLALMFFLVDQITLMEFSLFSIFGRNIIASLRGRLLLKWKRRRREDEGREADRSVSNRRRAAVCSLDQRAAMLPKPHTNRTPRWSNFRVEMDQSDGPTLTYATLFAVRSGAHRENCLWNSKEKQHHHYLLLGVKHHESPSGAGDGLSSASGSFRNISEF